MSFYSFGGSTPSSSLSTENKVFFGLRISRHIFECFGIIPAIEFFRIWWIICNKRIMPKTLENSCFGD
ncbi:MAG: hypothetical protein KU38_08640 [Sulfurovum sp. FS08-3]|nr:MAG: hypothetical protein KU38_08640 [Sulfurovum sp. FS08-3]